MNRTAIQILSSNIYTDKPLAIVRELSANALDAHNATNETCPFEVTLPTVLSPEFRIRDYGPGIHPDDIADIYLTYFASTKRGSNAQIGGFGLGSKTPLSYTDQFQVISRHAGKTSLYLVYINNDGIPDVVCLSTAPSDEASGLEIMLTVQPNDCNAFCAAAQQVLSHFPGGSYRTINYAIVPNYYTIETEDFAINATGNELSQRMTKVKMGPMVYSLDLGQCGYGFDYSFFRNATIKFPIGALSIQASREDLSYDHQTKERLNERLTELAPKIREAVLQHVKESGRSPLDLYYWAKTCQFPHSLVSEIQETAILRTSDLYLGIPPKGGQKAFRWETGFNPLYLTQTLLPETRIFIWVNSRRAPLKDFLTHNQELQADNVATFFLVGNKEHWNAVKAIVGNNLVEYADLPQPPKKPIARKSTIHKIYVYDFTAGNWMYSSVDLNQLDARHCCFAETRRAKTAREREVGQLRAFMAYSQFDLTAPTAVYSATPNSKAYRELKKRLPSLSDYFNQRARDWLWSEKGEKAKLRAKYFITVQHYWERLRHMTCNLSCEREFPQLREIRRLRRIMGAKHTAFYMVRTICDLADIEYTGGNEPVPKFWIKKTQRICEHYPLLTVFNYRSWDVTEDMLIRYFNLENHYRSTK